MKVEIVPSVIANDQKELDKVFNKIKTAKVLHLDVMDGSFVENKSLWFDFKLPKHEYEAHLMVDNPEEFIAKHHKEIKTFIVHVESAKNPEKLINIIKIFKNKIFLTLKPETPVSDIKNYLDKVDGVMVMTVKPGIYGAKFIPEMVEKIKELKQLKKDLVVEIDGSVNEETIKILKKAGATRFSVGSYIQKSKDVKKAMKKLQ